MPPLVEAFIWSAQLYPEGGNMMKKQIDKLSVSWFHPVPWQWTLVTLVMTLPMLGCGDNGLGLLPAYGTVTLDGKPLIGAQVIFESESSGPVTGRTDENGEYEMEYSDSRKGAFPGLNKVRINTGIIFGDSEIPEDILEGDQDEIEAKGYLPQEKVPARYNSESELTVNVEEGGAPYDFALTSD